MQPPDQSRVRYDVAVSLYFSPLFPLQKACLDQSVAVPCCTASLGSLGNKRSWSTPQRFFRPQCTGLAPCSVQLGREAPSRASV